MSSKILSGKDTADQTENFLKKYNEIEGTRLPGERRHKNRQDLGPRQVNSDLVKTISSPYKPKLNSLKNNYSEIRNKSMNSLTEVFLIFSLSRHNE